MTRGLAFETGPFLSCAVLCEKVLEERDGVKSAIRIIDRVTRTAVGPNPPEIMEPFRYDLAMLIKMKSGSARGMHRLGVQMVKPSGEAEPPMINSVMFEGEEDRGVDLMAQLAIQLDQVGIYWFYLTLNDAILTKIPLRVIYLPQVRQIAGSSEGPSASEP